MIGDIQNDSEGLFRKPSSCFKPSLSPSDEAKI